MKLLQQVIRRQPVGEVLCHEADCSVSTRRWLDNNISSISSIRQALWEEVQGGHQENHQLLSLIFHPCLAVVEVRCEERDDWPGHEETLSPALVLKVGLILRREGPHLSCLTIRAS